MNLSVLILIIFLEIELIVFKKKIGGNGKRVMFIFLNWLNYGVIMIFIEIDNSKSKIKLAVEFGRSRVEDLIEKIFYL